MNVGEEAEPNQQADAAPAKRERLHISDRQYQEYRRVLLDRGVASLMGVGPNGIALVDLVEAPQRSRLARYRLMHLRATRRARNRTTRLIVRGFYLLTLIVVASVTGELGNPSPIPRTSAGWLVTGISAIGTIWLIVDIWRLVAGSRADARYESMDNIFTAFEHGQIRKAT